MGTARDARRLALDAPDSLPAKGATDHPRSAMQCNLVHPDGIHGNKKKKYDQKKKNPPTHGEKTARPAGFCLSV